VTGRRSSTAPRRRANLAPTSPVGPTDNYDQPPSEIR